MVHPFTAAATVNVLVGIVGVFGVVVEFFIGIIVVTDDIFVVLIVVVSSRHIALIPLLLYSP